MLTCMTKSEKKSTKHVLCTYNWLGVALKPRSVLLVVPPRFALQLFDGQKLRMRFLRAKEMESTSTSKVCIAIIVMSRFVLLMRTCWK